MNFQSISNYFSQAITPENVQDFLLTMKELKTGEPRPVKSAETLQNTLKEHAFRRITVVARLIFIYVASMVVFPIPVTNPIIIVATPFVALPILSLIFRNDEIKKTRLAAQNSLNDKRILNVDISESDKLKKVINLTYVLEFILGF